MHHMVVFLVAVVVPMMTILYLVLLVMVMEEAEQLGLSGVRVENIHQQILLEKTT